MWAGLTKTLLSTIFLGATIGGSSYGISELVKNRKDKALLVETQSKKEPYISREEEISSSHDSNSEQHNEKIEVLVDNLKDKNENIAESLGNKENSEKDKELEKLSEKINPVELISSGDNDEISLEDENKNSEDVLQVLEVGQDNYYSPSEEEVREKQKRFDAEVENRNILLEVTWAYRDSGPQGKHCFLLTREQENKMPDIMNDESSDLEFCENDNDNIEETEWSLDKQLVWEQEGLWIRGEREAVKKLIIANSGSSDLFKMSRFIGKEFKESDSISDGFSELSSSCQITKREDIKSDWVEIKCINN